MCTQFWVPKTQVGGGEGRLELVVVEGCVCPRPARPWASFGISQPHAHSNAALAA
jgi:hypothetical protein